LESHARRAGPLGRKENEEGRKTKTRSSSGLAKNIGWVRSPIAHSAGIHTGAEADDPIFGAGM
jgi:hypothetical protein